MHPPGSQGKARSGEAGNLLLPRRHAPADAFFIAPSAQAFEAEPKRKTWGERWRLGRSSKSEESAMEVHTTYMVHPDYVSKFGTISPGVLTKSFKYAEAWLYGTVGVRGAPPQRPSLFLYPGVVAPSLRGAEHHAVLPRFSHTLNGTISNRSHGSAREVCQCPETRKGAECRHCGLQRGTHRPQSKVRPTLLGATSQEEPKVIASASDPYNLMRKSRLGVGETVEKSILNPKTKQKRTRSISPIHRQGSIPSFETFKPKNEQSWVSEPQSWESDEESLFRSKSILECNVNAYDLNKKDDSSDELSDGTLEINTKLKILRPKLNKTELKNRNIKIPEPKSLPDQEVRLNGQRFRIFDHSNTSTVNVEGYVSDKEDQLEDVPKRPPRRQKQNGSRLSKLRSTSSPNLSIKSILKKPNEEDIATKEVPSPVSAECGKVLDYSHKKLTQNTLKKKKQVQFRVNSLSESIASEIPAAAEVVSVEPKENVIALKEQPVETNLSLSCENVQQKTSSESKPEIDDRKHLAEAVGLQTDLVQGLSEVANSTTLKRSLSDRRPSSSMVRYKDEVLELSTSPPNSYLFNDTMALRSRASRFDTRDIFPEQLEDGLKPLSKPRPKEPPPPPPPPPLSDIKQATNMITYAEFSKLVDEAKDIPATAETPLTLPFSVPTETPKNRSDAHRIVLENISPPPCVKLCNNCESGIRKPKDEGATVVTITRSAAQKEVSKKTSIIINGNVQLENQNSSKRTSVIINNFQPGDSNKVTINVRNEDEAYSSSCSTIIETGSKSTVIPVVSTDNKTTLVVGEALLDGTLVELSTPNATFAAPAPVPYLFSSTTLLDNMDPVEAVKRNLVPHVCGKEEPTPPSLVERLNDEKEKNVAGLKQISKLFSNTASTVDSVFQPAESLLQTYQARKIAQWKLTEDTSAPTSRSNSFCGSLKASSRETSRSNSFNDSSTSSFLPLAVARSKFYVVSDSEEVSTQELDKLDDEYVIRNGIALEKKEENIYETIKENIYDEVGLKLKEEESDEDVPPELPTSLPPSLEELQHRASKSIFEGATKYDILSYLVDAKDRVQGETYLIDHRRMESLDGSELSELSTGKSNDSGIDAGPLSNSSDSSSEDRDSLLLNRKCSAEVERNDSGVGSETSQTSRSKWQASGVCSRDDPLHLCEDCDQPVETQVTDSGVMYAPLICRKCAKKRMERKEIIQEIVETEEKYGRDLRIILEEFYKPMLVAGLLTPDQLTTIFLNSEDLLENSESLTEKLRDTLEIAVEQGDEDLLTVNIGRLFLEAKPMLHAFESYCTRQASAAILLATLEKEKELLRIFLRVSQMENAVLRRMNLNSFLMVPVQRVTKYPLLLARLYKVTPPQHESRELLKEAQHNIELHLEHMNAEAKDAGGTKVWRRFSTTVSRKSTAEQEMTSIKLRKMAIDLLEWSHDEVRFVLEGRLLFAQPTDGNWKKGRTVKLQPIFVLLATLGKPNAKYRADALDGGLNFPSKTGVREATLLLIKEKCGRYTLIREPLFLDKLIICCESDTDDYLEVQELMTKETFIFKGEDVERTKEWYRQLQYHAQILGGWRRRRNALANIMITGMSYAA